MEKLTSSADGYFDRPLEQKRDSKHPFERVMEAIDFLDGVEDAYRLRQDYMREAIDGGFDLSQDGLPGRVPQIEKRYPGLKTGRDRLVHPDLIYQPFQSVA